MSPISHASFSITTISSYMCAQVIALTAVIYWLVRCLQPLLIALDTQGQWPPRGGSKSGWLEVREAGRVAPRQWGR